MTTFDVYMSRPVIHIIFWMVYLVQDTFLHFTWMGPIIKTVPEGQQFWMAVQTAFALLPAKLIIVYYFINFGVQKLVSDKKDWARLIPEIAIVVALSVGFFRITFHYLVYPRIYQLEVTASLFNARNILISILEVGYITGIAITLKLLRLQTSSRLREQNLIKEKLQTELKFLRNQTNPHFLFNTLNNIYGLARKKSDKTPEVVMKLSELLSFMIYESKKESIAISDEIQMMEDYISLEKIRYSDRLSVVMKKDIDNGSEPISPLLLLPLVENSFKHGVSETRFDSFIDIDIRLNRRNLFFCIENTVENGKVKSTNGNIGLSNIRRQLELMYGEHELLIDNHGKTFKVTITLNLDSYGKV
ncbi:MAG TPA: histidine kinase [Chitinophagaceae bacterium]